MTAPLPFRLHRAADIGLDVFGRAGRVTVRAYVCPLPLLSLFGDRQVTIYRATWDSGWWLQALSLVL